MGVKVSVSARMPSTPTGRATPGRLLARPAMLAWSLRWQRETMEQIEDLLMDPPVRAPHVLRRCKRNTISDLA
jgi:hypothetical protein